MREKSGSIEWRSRAGVSLGQGSFSARSILLNRNGTCSRRWAPMLTGWPLETHDVLHCRGESESAPDRRLSKASLCHALIYLLCSVSASITFW